MGATTATLSVSYSESTSTGKITLQQMTKDFTTHDPMTGQPALVIWCFPTDVEKFWTTVGSLRVGEIRDIPGIQRETLKFTNSNSASIKYPNATILSMTLLGTAVKRVKNNYDEWEIQDSYPEFTFKDQTVLASENFYGACMVDYTAQCKVLYYTPSYNIQSQTLGSYSITTTVGSIFALKDDLVEVLDVQLDLKSTKDRVEFARVSSKIVLDSRGAWEFPDSWNSTYTSNKKKDPDQRSAYNIGTFTGYSYQIDPDESFTDTRVHMIIYVDSSGHLTYEDYNNGGDGYWAWYNPYFGSSNYDPVYELTWSTAPGGEKASSAEAFQYDLNHTTWRDVFLKVDKNKIKEDMTKAFPNIVFNDKSRS